jgi:hypothetical protein
MQAHVTGDHTFSAVFLASAVQIPTPEICSVVVFTDGKRKRSEN